jgi:hypothetical protein
MCHQEMVIGRRCGILAAAIGGRHVFMPESTGLEGQSQEN